MSKITPFLWFDDQAEEAAKFYCSIFKNSKIVRMNRKGKEVWGVTLKLNGLELIAFNGGPSFKFTHAISLFVHCRTQREVDGYWAKLAKGGKAGQCGWVQDKYGLWWQIVPNVLVDLMADKDPVKAERVYNAMLKMSKIEIKKLKHAYNQK
jgi:predicted 3-demethylubiquinone-9 3-methyltransferase (glyoxalase superfamily)